MRAVQQLCLTLLLFINSALAETQLLVNDVTRVLVSDLGGFNTATLYDTTNGVFFAQAMAASSSTKQVFFLNSIGNLFYNIVVAKSNGGSTTVTEIVSNISFAGTIAVDDVNQKLYWTDSADIPSVPAPRRLLRSNFDGSGVEILNTGSDLGLGAFGVAVDPAGGKVYWSDAGGSQIVRSNIVGNGIIEPLYNVFGGALFGIAVNAQSGEIFWADQGLGIIQKANSDGSSPSPVTIISSLTNPLYIVADGPSGQIFFTENDTVQRANLDGSSRVTILQPPQVLAPIGLALVDGFPILTPNTVLVDPPAVSVSGRTVTVEAKEFSGVLLNQTKSSALTLPLLASTSDVRYQVNLTSGAGDTGNTYFTKVSKERQVSFKNIPPGDWVASYRAIVVKKRSPDKIEKFKSKFESQLAKAAKGSKQFKILSAQKLKLEAKYKIVFSTNQSPIAPFNVQ